MDKIEQIEKLVIEYRELRKKSKEAATEEEKKKLSKLASEKHDEILICQFDGDANIGRFNRF